MYELIRENKRNEKETRYVFVSWLISVFLLGFESTRLNSFRSLLSLSLILYLSLTPLLSFLLSIAPYSLTLKVSFFFPFSFSIYSICLFHTRLHAQWLSVFGTHSDNLDFLRWWLWLCAGLQQIVFGTSFFFFFLKWWFVQWRFSVFVFAYITERPAEGSRSFRNSEQ